MQTPRYSLLSLAGYGSLAFPLALLALPVYVYVPQFYAERFGMSLSLIGSALLLSRLLDAFSDPLIGLWVDRRAGHAYLRLIWMALPLMCAGFYALFHPPLWSATAAFVWFLLSLVLCYAGYSLASIAYLSWGAAITQRSGERLRLSSVRETCGLGGVICAAVLTQVSGISGITLMLTGSLLLAALLLTCIAPRPVIAPTTSTQILGWRQIFANRAFRALFLVFLLNGIAASIPATLFLFFVKDQLQLAQFAGYLLMLYFLAAAISMPVWLKLAVRWHESRAWLLAMLLACLSFVGAATLGPGSWLGFGLICLASGFSLGADLALPAALLAGVIHQAGHSGAHEASYAGLWSWASKASLALAAGLALPLLELLGYQPGTTDSAGLRALTIAYAVLPCLLKMLAAAMLWRSPLRSV